MVVFGGGWNGCWWKGYWGSRRARRDFLFVIEFGFSCRPVIEIGSSCHYRKIAVYHLLNNCLIIANRELESLPSRLSILQPLSLIPYLLKPSFIQSDYRQHFRPVG